MLSECSCLSHASEQKCAKKAIALVFTQLSDNLVCELINNLTRTNVWGNFSTMTMTFWPISDNINSNWQFLFSNRSLSKSVIKCTVNKVTVKILTSGINFKQVNGKRKYCTSGQLNGHNEQGALLFSGLCMGCDR